MMESFLVYKLLQRLLELRLESQCIILTWTLHSDWEAFEIGIYYLHLSQHFKNFTSIWKRSLFDPTND